MELTCTASWTDLQEVTLGKRPVPQGRSCGIPLREHPRMTNCGDRTGRGLAGVRGGACRTEQSGVAEHGRHGGPCRGGTSRVSSASAATPLATLPLRLRARPSRGRVARLCYLLRPHAGVAVPQNQGLIIIIKRRRWRPGQARPGQARRRALAAVRPPGSWATRKLRPETRLGCWKLAAPGVSWLETGVSPGRRDHACDAASLFLARAASPAIPPDGFRRRRPPWGRTAPSAANPTGLPSPSEESGISRGPRRAGSSALNLFLPSAHQGLAATSAGL